MGRQSSFPLIWYYIFRIMFHFPLFQGAGSHNRGVSVERRSPARTQPRTFVILFICSRCLYSFLQNSHFVNSLPCGLPAALCIGLPVCTVCWVGPSLRRMVCWHRDLRKRAGFGLRPLGVARWSAGCCTVWLRVCANSN